MTEHNHRRGTIRKKYPSTRVVTHVVVKKPGMSYRFGDAYTLVSETDEFFVVEELQFLEPLKNIRPPRNGRSYGYANKGGCGVIGKFSELRQDRICAKHVPFDFSQGHRGMAKAIRGAKKFVNSRFRFHENAETRKLAAFAEIEKSAE